MLPVSQQEVATTSLQSVHQKDLRTILSMSNPSPMLSPRLIPLPDPEPDELEIWQGVELQRPKSLDASSGVSKEATLALRRSISLSTLPTPKSSSKLNPILKEPTFSDFLSLSDDDIADDTPDTVAQPHTSSKSPRCTLPPDPPVLVSSPQISVGTQLLTLSPPLSTRPATAAAFEAARIAARYKFDLVYVVNLWPSHMGCSRNLAVTEESSPVSPVAHTDPAAGQTTLNSHTPRVGMTGRLLAAYGLPFIMSPFRISASVHLKMLRSGGWLEYRRGNGETGDFARGYSRSFYTGYSPDGRGWPVEGETAQGKPKKRRAKAPNRGIVFAAYRLPRTDESSTGSDAAELDALGRDAETLVDMLIDIHMTQRQRRPVALLRCLVGETGPLPIPSNPLLAV